MFVSLGSSCYVSWTLRRIGLQTKSLPLDWANSFDFSKIATFLTDEPASFLSDLAPSRHPYDLDPPDDVVHGPSLYSAKYDLRLPHEFETHPDITLDGIRARYRRRVDRFWKEIGSADRVIFVRTLADGLSMERDTFAAVVPSVKHFLDTLPRLRSKPAMILLSNNIEEPVDVGDYDIALIDRAVPVDCAFYQYGPFEISAEAAASFYESFFWTPHRDVADMIRCYRALAKAPGVRNHPADKSRPDGSAPMIRAGSAMAFAVSKPNARIEARSGIRWRRTPPS